MCIRDSLYIEKPYLETPEEENIVLSWGGGKEQIDKLEILYECNGQLGSFELENKGNGLYLLQKEFTEIESGVYTFTDIRSTELGVEYTYNLAEIGIGAAFGVNEYYPGYEPTEIEVQQPEEVAVISEYEVMNQELVEEIVGAALDLSLIHI